MERTETNLSPLETPKPPLRVALIASEHTLSEYQMFLQNLLVGLVDESIPVVLVAPPNCSLDSIIPPSVEVIRYPLFNIPLLAHQNKKILLERLERFKPTIIHCLCEKEAYLSKVLTRHLDIPYVLTVNSLQKRWNKFPVSAKRCARITTPSGSIERNIKAAFPNLPERVSTVKIGIFTDQTIKSFKVPSRTPSIIISSPLGDQNDTNRVLGAIKHLMLNGYEFMLAVSICPHEEKRLRQTLNTTDLSNISVVIPKLEPFQQVLAAGDIFIRHKPDATYNIHLLKAMSAGVATASCKDGIEDLIIEDKTGFTFDRNDELNIYSCLQKIFDSREHTQQIASQAQNHLKKEHSVTKMVSDLLEIYQNAQQWYKNQVQQ